jgi:methionine sulfoxide reductase heme-binding subunit
LRIIKVLVFFAALIPAFYLTFGIFTDNLGANPVEKILHQTGFWGLIFLVVTISITPLRKLTKVNKLIRFRRMFGLFGFFYILLHFAIYIGLDRFLEWEEIIEDISERPYITIGFTAFLLLTPLAITSTKGWIKRLGRNWAKLHKLVYLIVPLGVVHFWWLVKKDITEPLIFAVIVGGVLIFRLWKKKPAGV